jgi:hypothetical protein
MKCSRSCVEWNTVDRTLCDSRNLIRYITDTDALDIVVHELYHLKHPNHSPTYWRFVKREIPDYDRCRQWLRVHEGELVI